MRGRRPQGPEIIDRFDGSAEAKRRLKVVLEVTAGRLRLHEACAQLGVCEQRFHQIRDQALIAALAGVEPGTPGRPPRTLTPEQQQVQALEEQLAAQAIEMRATQAREEIALILPQVVQESAEKKTTQRRPQPRARSPSKKPNA
jgi:hypothetical protein